MRLGATKSSATSSYNGLGNQLWDLGGARPSLDLNFAGNKNLSDSISTKNLITFTRASSGTYVDSQGVIQMATTNLLLRSEEFDNATSWTVSNATITANAITAPNGQQTADKLVEDTAASIGHFVRPTPSPSLIAGQSFTYSVFAKAAERTFLQLILTGVGPGGANIIAGFNLSTGQAGTPSSGSSSIVNIGNGWYRCSLLITASTTTTSLAQIRLAQNSTGVASSYTGDGTSGIYIWGAQLEQSSTVGEYIPTTSTINSAPRFDHNPTTGESLGLLVEESRTNLLLQSEDLSTTWTADGAASVATNTITSPASTLTADTLTVSGGGANRVSQSYSVPSAGTYTLSVYAKAGTGNLLQLRQFLSGNDAYVIFNFSTGAMGSVSGGTSASASATALANGWYRLTLTNTYTGAASINIRIGGAVGSTETNTTFYLWGAQLEAGSFPTSYIPTTTAAVTRSADVASITGSNFSSWYRQDEGTLFVQYPNNVGIYAAFAVNDNSSNNRIQIANNPTSSAALGSIFSSGISQASSTSGAFVASGNTTAAFAYKTNDAALSANGNLPSTDQTVVVPTVNQAQIGTRASSTVYANGSIRRLTYWPQRLSDSTLQQITQ